MFAKANSTKVASRYGSITDRIYQRQAELEISSRVGGKTRSKQEFINKLIADGLIINGEDKYESGTSTIYLGKQKDGSYLYTINISGLETKEQIIADLIDSLPDANKPGNEHLKNMSFIIKIEEANQKVTLPISDANGLEINWDYITNPNLFEEPIELIGLGPENTENQIKISNLVNIKEKEDTQFKIMGSSGKKAEHIYAEPGNYEVQIRGTVSPETEFGGLFGYRYGSNIIEMKQWGENGFTYLNTISKNLTGTIPEPSINSFINVKNFYGTFTGFNSEKAMENFFNLVTEEKLMELMAATTEEERTAILETLPEKTRGIVEMFLFADTDGMTEEEIVEMQYSASIEISKLFPELTLNVPENLFINCPNIMSFSGTFANCSTLKSIPENLFINCSNAQSFYNTFNFCISLEKIPENLFENCSKVNNFTATFAHCISLTGPAPKLWERELEKPDLIGSGCFYLCKGLSNYDIIPDDWKDEYGI